MPIDPATLLAKVIDRAAEKCGPLPGTAAAQLLGDDALAELLSTPAACVLGPQWATRARHQTKQTQMTKANICLVLKVGWQSTGPCNAPRFADA
jgi:hypothetical protein